MTIGQHFLIYCQVLSRIAIRHFAGNLTHNNVMQCMTMWHDTWYLLRHVMVQMWLKTIRQHDIPVLNCHVSCRIIVCCDTSLCDALYYQVWYRMLLQVLSFTVKLRHMTFNVVLTGFCTCGSLFSNTNRVQFKTFLIIIYTKISGNGCRKWGIYKEWLNFTLSLGNLNILYKEHACLDCELQIKCLLY